MSTAPGGTVTPPTDAIRAVQALEQGDWRTAHALAAQLGQPGLAIGRLALSMRERALGLVAESWTALAEAAALAEAPGGRPSGHRPARRPGGPGEPAVLSWAAAAGSEFRRRLGHVGQREEFHARGQWRRIGESAYPKRTCLIEACTDHLTWVSFDHATWQAPWPGEWLPRNDRVTRGRYGEEGREYFLRRANELWHWVAPLRGSITRKVWDDLGTSRGLRGAATAALARRDDGRNQPCPLRAPHSLAIAFARSRD
jgi:hypothetical protein